MTRLGGFVICAVLVGACATNGSPSGNNGADYSGSGSIDEGSNGNDGSGMSGSDMTGSDDQGDDGPGMTGSGGGNTGGGNGSGGGTQVVGMTSPGNCAASNASTTYWPYPRNAPTVLGTPADHPWWGQGQNPPSGSELSFRPFSSGSTIECGSNKTERSYLDVTAGCLDSSAFQTANRGQIHGTTDGYYRSFALPRDAQDPNRMVKWTDQGGEYDFYFNGWTGNVSNPGFKVFARYLTEYDLYVASWREDGVVQIQKKECGVYTILKRIPNYPAPTPGQWHHIKFEVKGTHLALYTDGHLAVETDDDTFGAGTSGIRIDDAEGAYIDNWHVFAP
jgi:hypothetical protein